jgi:hypothetical protein
MRRSALLNAAILPKTPVAAWAERWIDTLDVETRTEENYRAYLRKPHPPPVGHHAPG